MTLADKLSIAFPDAKFSSIGDEIEWDKENDYSKPTEDEINAKFQDTQYQRDRAPNYPAIQEQLDLLYHDMTAGKGDKTGEWYKAVTKVKTDNPKPE